MRLTEEIKNRIITNSSHILDETYGATTDRMTEIFKEACAKHIASLDELKSRAKLLEQYHDFMLGTDVVEVRIKLEGEDYPVRYRVEIGYEYAVRYTRTKYSTERDDFVLNLDKLTGNAHDCGDMLKDRLEADRDIKTSLKFIMSRITTSKQLLREEPRCAIFFDDEGQFYVPDFKEKK